MHFHGEIIMPASDDFEKIIEKALASHAEEIQDEETGDWRYNNTGFYDWYVIGGRWAGNKLKHDISEEKLKAFYDVLQEKGVTVSSVQSGKQTLQPASQIPMVDSLWREHFPGKGDSCLLFSHSNNQYGASVKGTINGDICRFADCPMDMSCAHFAIINEDGELAFMLQKEVWNGVNFVKTEWNGIVEHALALATVRFLPYGEEYRMKCTPKQDWLVITMDYHT